MWIEDKEDFLWNADDIFLIKKLDCSYEGLPYYEIWIYINNNVYASHKSIFGSKVKSIRDEKFEDLKNELQR